MSTVPAGRGTSLGRTGRAGRAGPAGTGQARRPRPSAKVVFLAVLLVVLALYTEMAFAMEWRTVAGRIGAGFFPRIIGIGGIAVTLVALVRTIRSSIAVSEEDWVPAVEEDELGEADLGRHPGAVLLAVAAGAVLLVTLTTLGAIVASALFLVVMLWFLNRGMPMLNVVLALAVPIGLYVLFQGLLNAGLPPGILPAL